jgi:hypothetical protein
MLAETPNVLDFYLNTGGRIYEGPSFDQSVEYHAIKCDNTALHYEPTFSQASMHLQFENAIEQHL